MVRRVGLSVIFLSVSLSLFGESRESPERCVPWAVPGAKCDAKVDTSCHLCPEEIAYVAMRELMVTHALKSFIGYTHDSSIKKVPRLAFCCSGGGFRAMIATMGFLSGMQEIGLKDAVTYSATLSGSAWCYCHYLLRKHLQKITLSQFCDILQSRTEKPLLDTSCYDFEKLLDKTVAVLTERGRVEPSDLIGAILANRFWDDLDDFQNITFSPLRDAFSNIAFTRPFINEPFPLFPLMLPDVYPYEWLEVNPYMVGSGYLKAYIPTALLDSCFKNGRCQESFSEKSLGWFLGMIGSAYNVSVGDIIIDIAERSGDAWFLDIVQKVVGKLELFDDRIMTSPIHNFVWEMKGHPLNMRQELEIADAGMAFNLPFPLLWREGRYPDIILVCDATDDTNVDDCPEVHYAQTYAKEHGIKFPPLDNPRKLSDHVVVFEDEDDPSVPTIVYFANLEDVSTLAFEYSKEEFYGVHDPMKQAVIETKSVLQELIEKRIERIA